MLEAGLYYSNPKEGRPERFYWSKTNLLNPNFFKNVQGFLDNWLKVEILEVIDLQQFGNLKETSTSDYLVTLLGTVLKNPENPDTSLDLLLIDL